jgi:hypothetical protein
MAIESSSHFRKLGKLSIPCLRELLQAEARTVRRRHIQAALNFLCSPTHCRRESLRIDSVKLLVACLPDTLAYIKKFLEDESSTVSYERHFTLFCFLDLEVLPPDRKLQSQVLRLVTKYLRKARVNTAMAAWMAGDLLGDHWPSPESIAALCNIARRARHAVARKSAVHGLAHALDRATPEERARIKAILREIVRVDPDRSVRLSCRLTLQGKGK